jgi:hypothetical protein
MTSLVALVVVEDSLKEAFVLLTGIRLCNDQCQEPQ